MSEVTPSVTPTPPPTPPPATDWTTGFSDDVKGYVQNKGFKGAQDVVTSYINLEKLRGVPEERLLKLPESMDAPEARAVWERLGTPKEAKDYGLDPKLVGEHLAADFHEIGVPKDMVSKIVAKQNERQTAAKTAAEESQKLALAQQDLELKKEWGMAYDQNRAIVDSAAKTLGMNADEVKAMGQTLGMDKAMKMLLRLGTATGEHTYVSGQQATSSMLAPDQAKQRITALRGDADFREKLLKGDVEAKKTWDNAHRMAYPGEMSF